MPTVRSLASGMSAATKRTPLSRRVSKKAALEVQPEFRGTSFWKELFALCLHHSLEPRIQVPEIGYLNAFPLEFEGKVQGNEAAFARGKRRLQLLYAMNLGARVVTDEVPHGCLMQFPIR